MIEPDDGGDEGPADATAARCIEAVIGPEQAGKRIDSALAALIEGLSRSRLQALISEGAVSLDGQPIDDRGRAVRAGERYAVVLAAPVAAEPLGEAMALSIVHEDAHVVVVDKPAGLVVHPAAGHATGTLVNALIAHCGASLSGIGGVRRPGIVHRLDKDTSGLLVVAKTDIAHQGLAEQFRLHGADGRLERRYLAVVWGKPERQKGAVDAALARSRHNRLRMAVSRTEDARRAVTHYRMLESFRDGQGAIVASLLELTLETGRTHQIRVHMAHIGHPVVGDATYGTGFRTSAGRLGPEAQAALTALGRQALHAASLTIEHPATGKPLSFRAEPPADMSRLIAALRRESGAAAPKTGAGRRGGKR